MKNLLKDKEVAVIGAGPVGLALANLLMAKGVSVHVYERDENEFTRIKGGTLDIHKDTGQLALNEAGLLEDFYKLARPTASKLIDINGQIVAESKPNPENKHDNPEIDRNDLRMILLKNLDDKMISWNYKFAGLSPINGRWIIYFQNGIKVIADLVIGANGGMSEIRKYITNVKPEYTGTFLIQGEVKEPKKNCPDFFKLSGNSMCLVAGKGNILVTQPKGDGSISYFFTFRKPYDWVVSQKFDFSNTEMISKFLLKTMIDWHKNYHQLIKGTSYFVGLPMRKLDLSVPFKKKLSNPITLIGDSAHLMPPFAGKGVNIGLMDALILSKNLTGGVYNTIQSAIEDYERQMFVYAREAQLETLDNEIKFHDINFSFINWLEDYKVNKE